MRTARHSEVKLVVHPGDDFAPIAAIGSVLRLSPQASQTYPLQGMRLPQNLIVTARRAMHDVCGAPSSATVSGRKETRIRETSDRLRNSLRTPPDAPSEVNNYHADGISSVASSDCKSYRRALRLNFCRDEASSAISEFARDLNLGISFKQNVACGSTSAECAGAWVLVILRPNAGMPVA